MSPPAPSAVEDPHRRFNALTGQGVLVSPIAPAVDNDFPALTPQGGAAVAAGDELLRAETAQGQCRVPCLSPDHGKTLPQLPLTAVRGVVDAWCAQSAELGARWRWPSAQSGPANAWC